MNNRTGILCVLLLTCFSAVTYGQTDTAYVYSDRADTLAGAVATAGSGNYLSKGKEIRTEVITAAGLCKMACCNLAESFENSASVTVGYSDAVTGARQIRLLGLSGVYTQMLDENRPAMRGLAAPFGLAYVPGQWLNSIQIAKGVPSVINGVESITGQINLEHRKPTDEIPFFVNASFMSDLKADLNLASSLQLNDRLSTVFLGHVSGNFIGHDMNGDGLLDEPRQFQLNLANRWLYFADNGVQLRFGVRFLRDTRSGGEYDPSFSVKQPAYIRDAYLNPEAGTMSRFWGSSIFNQNFNAYLKIGVPLNEDNTRNVALVADFSDHMSDGGFGRSSYSATQLSGFANLLFQDQSVEDHHYTLGLSAMYDNFDERLDRYVPAQRWKTAVPRSDLLDLGVFGEYTWHYEDKLSVIAGLRGDWYNRNGLRCSPRLTVRYNPVEKMVLRLNGGRGLRYASPVTDNIGCLSTSKSFYSEHARTSDGKTPLFASHPLEDAWIVGGNATFYLPFGASDATYLSLDYFRTQFVSQVIADYDYNGGNTVIDFHMLDGRSFTNTYQLDFNVEPVRRFTVTATFRYTDAKVSLPNRGLQERPMTSRFKGVLNLQYATNLNKWIFDLTASVNGPCRVYDFMARENPDLYKNGLSPVYPLLYFQITHRMRGWDIYAGGENLTNFTQKDVLLGTDMKADGRALTKNPELSDFDASCVWGPLMGIRAYIGIRVTLWKKG